MNSIKWKILLTICLVARQVWKLFYSENFSSVDDPIISDDFRRYYHEIPESVWWNCSKLKVNSIYHLLYCSILFIVLFYIFRCGLFIEHMDVYVVLWTSNKLTTEYTFLTITTGFKIIQRWNCHVCFLFAIPMEFIWWEFII